MSSLDDLLDAIPFDQVAAQLGVSEDEAKAATRQAVPALLDGLSANAQDPAGAASIDAALDRHDGGLTNSGVDLGSIDLADGSKILDHIFGANRDQVTNQLGSLGGGDSLFSKLLPMLAPLVMSYLGGKKASSSDSSGGLTDLLGSLLGGGSGGLGDLLGGLLGGGTR